MPSTTDLFTSVPWDPYPSLTTPGPAKSYHKAKVPYVANANSLQYLDIWIPTLGSTNTDPPSASTIPSRAGKWIVYVHGGAWRDPLVLADSFNHTVNQLLDPATPAAALDATVKGIAGIASINYSLTEHPRHPTLPSPPTDGSAPDPARLARHPDHIVDVLTAIKFLQDLAGFGHDYVLLGHSCGATLAFQVAAAHGRWGEKAASIGAAKPSAVVGLNGLYDMPLLIADPGPDHAPIRDVYIDFTKRAFGGDQSVWRDISPASFVRKDEWQEASQVVLVQSKEDKLVPYSQTEEMLKVLEREFGDKSRELTADGDHNVLWQEGQRLAEIVGNVLEKS